MTGSKQQLTCNKALKAQTSTNKHKSKSRRTCLLSLHVVSVSVSVCACGWVRFRRSEDREQKKESKREEGKKEGVDGLGWGGMGLDWTDGVVTQKTGCQKNVHRGKPTATYWRQQTSTETAAAIKTAEMLIGNLCIRRTQDGSNGNNRQHDDDTNVYTPMRRLLVGGGD